MLLNANFKEERNLVSDWEWKYERLYCEFGYEIIAVQEYRLGLYNEMKKMKSSIK
jgi:hypothetical protein